MTETRPVKLALIGGGNMARALLMGALDSGIAESWEVGVADPSAPQRQVLTRLGIRCVERAEDLASIIDDDTQLLLAVKPQALEEVARDANAPLTNPRVIISILAGTPSSKVRAALGDNARVVRCMPNTPCRVRRGMTAIALGDGAQEGDDELAVKLFEAVGKVARIDESMMNAYTAVVGSGPAYTFYLAEAMTDAARQMGFDEKVADKIVRQTIRGSGAMLSELLDQSPEELRQAVTSPGGTTEAATDSLDNDQVIDAFVRALIAARDRGAELGAG
ncbi:MAG: pyrroline-5-carboxylate reductase [Planctomycetota bacterium]|jgi:pyrroline-5-carboxylate reductase